MPSSSTCKPATTSLKPGKLPMYKVLLHNDPVNQAEFILEKVMEIVHLEEIDAIEKVKEAHTTSVALLLVTTLERAEFICEQFKTFKITVTCEKE